MPSFHERLKELRQLKGISQKQIATDLEIAARNYQRYEYAEREPSISIATALAEYFNVSIDYLVGRTDNPKVNE